MTDPILHEIKAAEPRQRSEILRRALVSADPSARPEILRQIGFKPEDAEDYLAVLNHGLSVFQKPPAQKLKSDERIADMFQRIQAMQAKAAAQPKEQREVDEKAEKFHRDKLLGDYLLGDNARHREASYFNPELRRTEVIRVLLHEFRASGKRSLLMLGGAGAGKTWGVMAYVKGQAQTELNPQRSKVVYSNCHFTTAFDLAELRRKKASPDRDKDLEHIAAVRHLIIDDLGAEPGSYAGADFISYFDSLIDKRYQRQLCTYITSNAELERTDGRPDFKTVYGDRVCSRIAQDGFVREITEGDLRREKEQE